MRTTRWRVLLGLLVAAVLLAGTSCRPQPGTTYEGQASYYSGPAATGACGLVDVTSDLFVAINEEQFTESAACGAWLRVTGPDGTVVVPVVDSCPAGEPCGTSPNLDLSEAAFDAVADPTLGVVDVSWEVVDPGDIGDLVVLVDPGASEYYLSIRISNTRAMIDTVELLVGPTWELMQRQPWNAFTYVPSASPVYGPLSIRITGQTGEVLTLLDAVPLVPGATVGAGTQFSSWAPEG